MSSNCIVQENLLDEFFGIPSLPPSPLSPQRMPGTDVESVVALQDILKDNHRRHHIFYNFKGFHNHVTHRTLPIYALGGSGQIIRDYYERDSKVQRPAFKSPEAITEENFVNHLGDEKYYQAFVSFFAKRISEKGAAATLEEFVFSERYNFQEGRDANTQPEMLLRLYAGIMHSLIHIGYGAEFGLKGVFVEGLAQVAVHNFRIRGTFPPSLFASGLANTAGNVPSRLSSLALEDPSSTTTPFVSKIGGVHVFDILARMLKDDRFGGLSAADYKSRHNEILAKYTPILWEYTERWTIDLSQHGEIERKMEELVWLTSSLYGACGVTPNGFKSEFFFMHLVASGIFLPSIIAYLSPRAQVILFRGYFFTVLSWWVMRNRPTLNIKAFMTTTPTKPSVATSPDAKGPLTTETTPTPNPFLPILQSSIAHPIEHVIKIQRALAHYSTVYGTRPAGYFKGTELEGAELLDGTLFLRCSLLTADCVGWVREGEELRSFNQEGFFV